MNRMYSALALIALTGATLAAPAAWAEEEGATRHEQTLVEQNRHLAEAAQLESAANAADALRDAAKVDLDIRFLGHTSLLIAGDFKEVL